MQCVYHIHNFKHVYRVNKNISKHVHIKIHAMHIYLLTHTHMYAHTVAHTHAFTHMHCTMANNLYNVGY